MAEFIKTNCPFDIDEQTLIIGHSSGAILALIVAQELKTSIGAITAVSVFIDNSLGWEPNDKLFDVAFDWPAIQSHVQSLLFVHSDNDPYVPLEQAQFTAEHCDAELVVVPGEGHFNLEKSQDYRQFPKLIQLMSRKGML